MKTTRFYKWMFLAVLMLSIGTVTSCKDDDDDKVNDEQRLDPMATDEALVAQRWICALTDASELSSNWNNKTYVPTISDASEENAHTRLVVVDDIDEARQHFADLADVEPSQLAQSFTVKGGSVGTMTWQPSAANAQNLAEVTVNLAAIPTLQKIVYCTSEQTGVNGVLRQFGW